MKNIRKYDIIYLGKAPNGDYRIVTTGVYIMILKNFSDLICMELETVLFSFEVSPIKKKDYICFAIQSNGRKYFLLGGYDHNEYLEFVRDFVPRGVSFKKFQEEIECSKVFVQAFRQRFLRMVETDKASDMSHWNVICEAEYFKTYGEPQGLDGFSLTAYIPKQEKKIHFWCHYRNDSFVHLATCANDLLEYLGVEQEYRFTRCR